MNSAFKRKALGDLLNTAKTNKQLFQNVLNNTPKIKTNALNGFSSAKKINIQAACVESKQKTDDYLEERFVQPPMDTFNDLFENGRLSEIILNKKLKHVAYLPIGMVMNNEARCLKEINVLNDIDWKKQMSKYIKEEVQTECAELCNDIPKLEDLGFRIPDNFDLMI